MSHVNPRKRYRVDYATYRCTNPNCIKGSDFTFGSQRALTMHWFHNSACREYNEVQQSRPTGQAFANTFSSYTIEQKDDAVDENVIPSNVGVREDNTASPLLSNDATNTSPSVVEYNQQHADETNFIFSMKQSSIVKLMKLLDDMNCPDYALSSILNWVADVQDNNHNFESTPRNRAANIQWMRKMLENANQLLPIAVPTAISPTQSMDVVCFDFVSQLLSLVQDRNKMVQCNLVIDVNDPISLPSRSFHKPIGEVIDGVAYREAYNVAQLRHQMTGSTRPLLVIPICCWGDATHIDQHSRFKLEPWSFSPLIFTEEIRRDAEFWRVLGYLNVLKLSSAQRKGIGRGEPCRIYHKQLSVILKSLRHSQTRLQNVNVPLGPHKSMWVDIVCPLLYVIADTEGADKMCGRYICYQKIRRRCRVCDVNEEEFVKPDCMYTLTNSLEMTTFQSEGNVQQCQEYSMHVVDNAFHNLNMGAATNGIFTATPPDVLHVVRKGLVEEMVKLVLSILTDSQKASLDTLALHYHKTQRQRCRAQYPKTHYPSGFTNLSHLQAHEWVGVTFLLVILSQTQAGWDIINTALMNNGFSGLSESLQIFEAVLCFDAWLHKDTFWPHGSAAEGEAVALTSIQKLMHLCLEHFPNSWVKPKFHMLVHIPHYISKFGSPNNYDAQRPENSHIKVAKCPGRRANKTHDGQEYEGNVAKRLADTIVIDTLYHKMFGDSISNLDTTVDETESNAGDSYVICKGTKCMLHKTCQKSPSQQSYYYIEEKWLTRNAVLPNQHRYRLLPKVATGLIRHYKCTRLITCTELTIEGRLYRCHPYYRQQGPHYDWLLIKTSSGDVVPAKLVAIVPSLVDPDVFNVQLTEPYVVIQPCSEKTECGSTLFSEWIISDKFKIYPATKIKRPCLTVVLNESKVRVCKDHSDWPVEFTDG